MFPCIEKPIIQVVKKPFKFVNHILVFVNIVCFYFKKETMYELYTFCEWEIISCQKLTIYHESENIKTNYANET